MFGIMWPERSPTSMMLNVFLGESVQDNLVQVVEYLPEFFNWVNRGGKINSELEFVIVLLNTKQNNTAQRICKGRMILPNAVGQPTDSFICIFIMWVRSIMEASS